MSQTFEQVKELRSQGKSPKEIADALGLQQKIIAGYVNLLEPQNDSEESSSQKNAERKFTRRRECEGGINACARKVFLDGSDDLYFLEKSRPTSRLNNISQRVSDEPADEQLINIASLVEQLSPVKKGVIQEIFYDGKNPSTISETLTRGQNRFFQIRRAALADLKYGLTYGNVPLRDANSPPERRDGYTDGELLLTYLFWRSGAFRVKELPSEINKVWHEGKQGRTRVAIKTSLYHPHYRARIDSARQKYLSS